MFYDAAFEALFTKHDAYKYGYKRITKSKLDKLQFQTVFSAFCLYTYDENLIAFTSIDALKFIKKASKVVGITVDPQDFLDDAMQAVCLLIEDGIYITFAHRSFQEYFVAKYIEFARVAQNTSFVKRYLPRINTDQALPLLYEINPPFFEGEIVKHAEQIFTKIGVRDTISKENYIKYMKSSFIAWTLVDKTKTSLSMQEDTLWHLELFRYLANTLSGIYSPINLLALNEFQKQHKEETYPVKLVMKNINIRTKWVRFFSDSGIGLSFEELQAAYSAYMKLKKNNLGAQKALDDIFK